MRREVFREVDIQIMIYGFIKFCPEYGDSRFLRNTDEHLPDYNVP
jgi:hypothetical protein